MTFNLVVVRWYDDCLLVGMMTSDTIFHATCVRAFQKIEAVLLLSECTVNELDVAFTVIVTQHMLVTMWYDMQSHESAPKLLSETYGSDFDVPLSSTLVINMQSPLAHYASAMMYCIGSQAFIHSWLCSDTHGGVILDRQETIDT